MKKITPSEYYKLVRKHKNEFEKIKKANQAKIYKILSSKNKKIIEYPEYKDAFDYVEKKYPGLNVLSVKIFEVPKEELEDIGFGGAGGLYVFSQKKVIVSDKPSGTFDKNTISARLSKDEVIVHELLHYVSHKFSKSNSLIMEEEFAYGNSVPYLISKGFTDEDIIKHNMLPFLYGIIDTNGVLKEVLLGKGITKAQFNSLLRNYNKDRENKKYKEAVSDIYKELHEKTMSKALEAGQFLVDKYRDLPDGEVNDESDYDHIDI